jgi:hypothetical protein
MKIVLICHHDDDLNRLALARWVGSFAQLAGIVCIEEGREQKKNRIRREINRLGYLRFLDVLAYRLYHRFFVQAHDLVYEKGLLESLNSRYPALQADLPVLTTKSPNSPINREFLAKLQPDLMIARCKVILKPEIFEIPRLGTWVMHPGICPEYRNAHGCFWALAERDLTRVGMTLLKVDRGIDTGPVYGYFSYAFDELRESHITIQHRTVFENLEKLREKFLEIEKGTAVKIDTTHRASANWGQPWLTRYLAWKLAARRGRAKARPEKIDA